MTMAGFPETIGAYRVEQEIGRGGMGIVYRAHDTKLDRAVAVKVLPDELLEDADRLARFEREARMLAMLNHPNVAQIYGVEEQDGRKFLVLEYVEGETLEERLERGGIPVDEAIEIAIEICGGLDAAHEAGVVHRDLKPANIKLTPEGKVKLLDFGLAKAGDSAVSDSDPYNSPTLTSPARHSPSIPGAILGTVPYMSPEQARGRRVDKRTDIWSFGVVLYEMLTGIGPFLGETVTDSIGAILHKDVDMGLLPPDTPPAARFVIRRCLERDKARRLHDIADARIELEDAGDGHVQTASGHRGGPRVAVTVTVVAALLVGAAFVGRITSRQGRDNSTPLQMQVAGPRDSRLLFFGDLAGPAKVSPDGQNIVFAARDTDGVARLWIRPLNERDAHVLVGTDKATFPFWSPDSQSIGFFVDQRLRRLDLDTASVYTVCAVRAGRGGTWTTSGEILFSPGFRQALERVDATGGEPSALTELDETLHTSHRWPYALPDGKHFIFSAVHHDPSRQEGTVLMLGSVDGSAPRPIIRSTYRAEVVDGTLLFMREGTLMAARLDVDGARLEGDPIPIVRSVSEDPSTWHAGFSASPTGVLVYHRARTAADGTTDATVTSLGAESNVTVVVDRSGRRIFTIAENVPQISTGLSPNGDTLAVTASPERQSDYDIWLYLTGYTDAYFNETGDMTSWESSVFSPQPIRLGSEPGTEIRPTWSPDATQIAYGRIWGEENLGIYKRTIGRGDEQLVLTQPLGNPDQVWPTDWSVDGRWLILTRGSWIGDRAGDVMLVSAEGGEPTPLVAGPADEGDAAVSPDGRWLAYVSDETGTLELYVIPFAPTWPDRQIDPAAPSPRWQVSIAGGESPAWNGDGTELFFVAPDGTIMSVRTDITSDVFRSDSGTPLFVAPWEAGSQFHALKDGQRFFVSDTTQNSNEPISVVLNWQGLLERRQHGRGY